MSVRGTPYFLPCNAAHQEPLEVVHIPLHRQYPRQTDVIRQLPNPLVHAQDLNLIAGSIHHPREPLPQAEPLDQLVHFLDPFDERRDVNFGRRAAPALDDDTGGDARAALVKRVERRLVALDGVHRFPDVLEGLENHVDQREVLPYVNDEGCQVWHGRAYPEREPGGPRRNVHKVRIHTPLYICTYVHDMYE